MFNGGDMAIAYRIIEILRHEFRESIEFAFVDGSANGARRYYLELTVFQMVDPGAGMRDRTPVSRLKRAAHRLRLKL